jgi:hypothetical protein
MTARNNGHRHDPRRGRERDPGNRDYSGVGPEDECADSSPKNQMNAAIHLFGKAIMGASAESGESVEV